MAAVGADDEDPRESARVRAARRRLGIGATCAMPLGGGASPLGAIAISRERDRRDFDEAEIELFRTVVHQLCAALARGELAAALHHQAWHDALTGLSNRRRFERALGEAIERARLAGTGLTLAFLDLDGFKPVNDLHGHAAGDALLASVASRLAARLGARGELARLGGDEFALLIEETAGDADGVGALDAVADVRGAFAERFDLDWITVEVGASVGLARFPRDGTEAGELLVAADLAMYRAKRGGRDAMVRYEPGFGVESRHRSELERELRAALERDEFELLWQPQTSCRSGRAVAVEALVRWRHPARGLLPPDAFVPVAEEAGLIDAIGERMVEGAVRRLAAWTGGAHGEALAGVRLAVNVAASQFRSARFVDDVLGALARHGAPAARLELEITESLAMDDIDSTLPRLARLRAAGVRVAIDDFGTGHSSLGRLQDLPVDVLKVDRSFVARLGDGPRPRALLHSILMMATGLGLETVVEGVETASQLRAVTDMGAGLVQGFVHSRPVAEPSLVETLERIDDAARQVA